MYLLEMKDITKKFGDFKALDKISMQLKAGECCGLCGENGSGKSTLMKVLSAVWPHGTWEGSITFNGEDLTAKSIQETEEKGIVIIHQELMLVPELSVAENIFMGREPKTKYGFIDFEKMFTDSKELLRKLGIDSIDVTAPIMNYGGGHQQLIEIAKALSKNAKLIIFDEPSSSLTISEIEKLLSIIEDLKLLGIGCVYVSHKLDEVKRICDFVTVIRDGEYIGTERTDKLSVDDIVTMMVGREMNELFPREDHEIGDVLLEVKNVQCFDRTNSQLEKVKNVSFNVRKGEILGISGLVGAGRTETLSAIFGAYSGKHTKEVYLEGKKLKINKPKDSINYGIAMVPEDRKRDGIIAIQSVGMNVTTTTLTNFSNQLNVIDESKEIQTINHRVKELNIKSPSIDTHIGSLSGGNQQKAVIAKMLEVQPKVLILDEPTRGVDVGAKYEIYKLIFGIVKNGTSIIMASSELAEVLGISDRILVFGEGEIKGEFINDGSLDQETIMASAIS
ncbi:MAG: xylose ABC transporter ATP-binding protein [Vibrio sp.]